MIAYIHEVNELSMKRGLLSTLLVLFAFTTNAQISSDTLTYVRGTLGVQGVFPVNINSQSICADTLGISIPSGHWISSIELKYELQTQAGGFGGVAPNDVGTYVELVSEGTKESALTYGTSGTNGTTESVSRTINQFNGAVTDTFLVFKLHPLRQAFTAVCDTNSARITDSTYQIIINHYPAPTCFQPTNLAVDWTMSNQAQLSWTTGGSSSWEIEYGAPGFTPGTGTRVAALTNPFVVSGLTASTSYEFIVRDSCAVGDVSLWSTAATDSTLCAPITFTTSYIENFNNTTDWVPGSGFDNDGSTVASCWVRNPSGPNGGQGYAWGVADDSTGTPGTGPTAGRGGSGQYIYAEASGAANQSVAEITSPLIDLSALSVPELNFYYHMRGAQINELKTEVWSKSTGWVNMGAINGPQQSALSDTFLLQTYTLSQFADDTVLVRFSASRGFGQDNQADIAIDDFSLEEAPTCPDPSNLTVVSRTMTSITIGWTAVNATSWDIQYGGSGATLGAATNTTVSASSNPFELTGLSSGTAYQFWVREVCGPTDRSGWIGPILATTHCAPISAPWSENFDSTSWTPGSGVYNAGDGLASCWARTPEKDTLPSSPFSWGVRTAGTSTGQTGPTADVSGTGNYLYAEASGGAPNQEAFVESPMIDMSTLLKPQVSFYYNMRGFFVNTLKLQVWVDSTQTWDTYFTKSGNQGNQWLFEEVDLSGFAGDTIVLRWSATKGNGSQGDIAIDEIVVDDQPLCPDPSNFTLTDVTSTTATFSWTTGGSATWNLVVGTLGFTPSAVGATNLTATTGVASGLTAGTTYDAYVRDTCGTLGASMWIGPITFNTLCNPVAAPYTENFDSTSWVTGANQSPGQIDGCWQRNDTIEYFWKAGPPTNHSANTGPSADHTSGSGGYVFTEANTGFGGSSVFTNELISPLVDVSPLTVPELTFWYHMYGTLINKLVVQVRTAGGSWATLNTITGSQQTAATDAWKEQVVDLSSYAGDTIQIKFIAHRYQGFNNQVDVSLDDVDIHEKPNCPKPTNFTAANVTSSSVDLSWITGGSVNWLVKYAPGAIVPAGTNPFTLSGLSPNTTYDLYVKDSCAVGDVSSWVGPISITTLCGMETAPWTEDFEGTGFDAATGDFDPCYTISSSANYAWESGTGATPSGNTGPSSDHTTGSGKYGFTEAGFAFNGDTEAEMESMEIDLDTLSTPELRFWWHGAGNLIDELEVEIYDGSTWTSELTINSTNNTLQAGPGDPWEEAVIDLAAYIGDTIKIRFTASRTSSFGTQADWAIDDIEIDNAPTCLKPTVIASTGNTTTSVTLSWTTGGANNWHIEYGAPGFMPGNGTVVNATTNPFTVTGLNPSTYYDFWVRDSCSATDLSDWAGPFTASTACGTAVAPYLEDFENGFIGGIDNGSGHNIGATISPCWTRTDTDTNYRWGGRSGGTATGNTGPGSDHTTGFGSYVYVEASFSTGTPTATLESPSIDLSALTTPEMKFWYHMFAGNGSQGTLVWSIQDVALGLWVDLDSISGSQGNNWIEVVEDLSAYANKTVKLKFTATKSGAATPQQGDIALDDLTIDEAPTCLDPSGFTASAISTTDIELSWTTGGATSWQIEYGTPGFTPGTGTVVNALTNPFTVTGLTSGASYDFYVRDSCGAGDVSLWVGPASATTFTCVGGCSYTLELTDDFGDGWAANGQYTQFHQLAVTTGTVTTNYTMSNTSGGLGSSETFTINVCDGDTIYLEFIDNGQWNDECGLTLTDPNGIVVATVTIGTMTAGIQYQGAADCSSPCPAPIPSFTAVDNFLSLDFDATASTGVLLTYTWDFGDGNNGSGVTPTHVYAAAGTYVVTLTATDSCNQSVDLVDTIQVCEELNIANVTYTQSAFDINFSASNVTGADSAFWTYGDGNSGGGLNATNTYASSGNFQVNVSVFNACGKQKDSTFFITVCVQPTATFSAKILSAGGSGMQVQFDGTNSTGGNSYSWNFGDGNTNTTSNYPLHTYAVSSTSYVVSLTVFNTCGDSDTYSSVLGDALGEDEYTLFNLRVFPNPANGFITIQSDAGMQGTISLIDALGRLVVEMNCDGMSSQAIDVRDLSAGSYVLRVLNNGQLFQERVQIVK